MDDCKKECRKCKHYWVLTPEEDLYIDWCYHEEHNGAISPVMFYCDDFEPLLEEQEVENE